MTESKPLALITGASSGLGACFARSLAADFRLAITARRADRLNELAAELKTNSGADVIVLPCDLTLQDERVKLLSELEQRGLDVELLINNAGFGSVGAFSDCQVKQQLEMIELNCKAATHLSHCILEQMRARRRGHIMNICSTCAFQPMPYMATYAATKAYLVSFSMALAVEAKDYGVAVSAICPGPTRTEFHIAAGLPEKIAVIPPMSAEAVVEQSLRLLENKRELIVNGKLNRALSLLPRFLPNALSSRIVERILRGYTAP